MGYVFLAGFFLGDFFAGFAAGLEVDFAAGFFVDLPADFAGRAARADSAAPFFLEDDADLSPKMRSQPSENFSVEPVCTV